MILITCGGVETCYDFLESSNKRVMSISSSRAGRMRRNWPETYLCFRKGDPFSIRT